MVSVANLPPSARDHIEFLNRTGEVITWANLSAALAPGGVCGEHGISCSNDVSRTMQAHGLTTNAQLEEFERGAGSAYLEYSKGEN